MQKLKQQIEVLNSVGQRAINKPIDVALVQKLLKDYFKKKSDLNRASALGIQQDFSIGPRGPRSVCDQLKALHTLVVPSSIVRNNQENYQNQRFARLVVNGYVTPELISAIKRFQTNVLKVESPDGRVDPRGKTFNALLAEQKSKPTDLRTFLFGPDIVPKESIATITALHFKSFFQKYLGLTTSKGEDFLGFFAPLQSDADVTDLRWAAYMLATVYIETEFSFIPCRENLLGQGKLYGIEIEVVDSHGIRGKKNKKYKNIYYGRGYCQLTWEDNYLEIGKALGYDNKLYIDPDLALQKDIAYKVISYGMRHGSFTRKKLSHYINIAKTDYKNARRIINGQDKAEEIAEYANKIEFLLRLAAQPITAIR
ncbi:hypothetical protein [Pseudoalteromonas ruthenica]|uniref:hypothetical protein n=1 Tax=Pseudoalteromonas ruthenica TaxID=151081 RepID=UPI00241C0225|nr:hypothetical protein [Pseudoalteromonas ruthenica]|tara:strand:+ start:25506 stop:26612 length:1107 start_codon:yes stop_codon:yes gene_type:complete